VSRVVVVVVIGSGGRRREGEVSKGGEGIDNGNKGIDNGLLVVITSSPTLCDGSQGVTHQTAQHTLQHK